MKLTAPPPPPPEPPEPPEPGSGPEPNREGGESGTEAAAVQTVPGEEAAPAEAAKPEPKPATWPGWFGGFDAALAGIAIVIGFLASSFAARNSDLWLHLGAGRMLTTGEYSLGSDPLSYSAADRPWVNHSWLYDLGSYLLYSTDGDGFTLVLVKSIAVVVALGLLIGIRRPGESLWPWAAFAVIGVIAAAPMLTLRPPVGSVLLLSATLFLLFRVPNPPGSWRIPIAIGVVFWIWANVDAWFILGPATLALLLVGELTLRGMSGSEAGEESDPLLPLPDRKTLLRALLVGIVACMLNPHHVRVWQLPIEVSTMWPFSSPVTTDPEFRSLVVSPLSADYWNNPSLGYNLNGLAYAILLVAGVYAVALTGAVGRLIGPPADVDPLPLPHAILWCVFAALSLLTAHAIPFLAVVTIPLVASRLNIFSSKVRLGHWGDRKTRLVLTGSAAGRVATMALFVALGVIAWPGWLHPPGWESPPGWQPSEARRVAWGVEPDAALAEAAQQFQQWREAGELPAEAHGIMTTVELANYCAWYAPKEKVFINGRYRHHRPELADFVKLRSGLHLYPQNEPGDPKEAREVMASRNAHYLAVTSVRNDPAEVRERVEQTTDSLLGSWIRWAPWALRGRTAVFGWRPEQDSSRPEFDRLRIDSVRGAFGPEVDRLVATEVQPVPPPREWIDEFLRPVAPPSPDAYESIAWMRYKGVLQRRQIEHYQLRALVLRNVVGGLPPLLANLYQAQAVETLRGGNPSYFHPEKGSRDEGSLLAIPILALRAARRAIAANPDHPDGYFALAQALEDRDLPLGDDERILGMITAYRQCLSRIPPPAEFRRDVYAASPTHAAQRLTLLYLNPDRNDNFRGPPVNMPAFRELVGDMIVVQGQGSMRVPLSANVNLPPGARVVGGPFVLPLDLAQKSAMLAEEYARREFADETADRREAISKGLEAERKAIEAVLTQAFDRYRTVAQRPGVKLKDRYSFARTLGLVGEAITILKEIKEGDLIREFGQEAPRVALEQIALELVCGRLEDAAGNLAAVKSGFADLARQTPPIPGLDGLQLLLRHLEYRKLILEGNYAAAGSELESLEGAIARVQFSPKLTRMTTWPFHKFGEQWAIFPILGATDGPLGVLSRLALSDAQLQQYLNTRQEIAGVLERQATFFYQRGYLSLLEGDIPSARERFRQSLEQCKPPPGEWGLANPRLPAAVDYLRLIDRANGPPQKP